MAESINFVSSFGYKSFSFKINFFLSEIKFGFITTWYAFIFLAISSPFLSTISLLIGLKYGKLFLELLKLEFWSDVNIILIEKIKINKPDNFKLQ